MSDDSDDLRVRAIIVEGRKTRAVPKSYSRADAAALATVLDHNDALIRDWCAACTSADFQRELDELRAAPAGPDRESAVRILATLIRYWSSNGVGFTSDGKPVQSLIAHFGVIVACRLAGVRPDDDPRALLARWQTPAAAIGRDRFHGEVDHGDLISRNLAITAFVERAQRAGGERRDAMRAAGRRFGLSDASIRAACAELEKLGVDLSDPDTWTDAALDELLAPWARRSHSQTPR